MAALDALTAADSLARGFAPGGSSSIALTTNSAASFEGRAEERRLRAHVDDVPRWVKHSETFYVDSKMVPLVCSAGAVVPDNSTLQAYDLPSPYGFLLISGGATLCHLQEAGSSEQISAEAFNAYVWATFGGGAYVLRLERAPDRWFLLDAVDVPFGQPLPAPPRSRDRRFPRRLIIPGGTPNQTHTQVALPLGPEARDLIDAPESQDSDAAIRWLIACWRLMGQTIAEVVDKQPSRQVQRQLERKNVPLKQVSVIRLRHLGAKGNGEATVNWSHRWVVRGHWRQQRCKDENGAWTTRPVFIHPYIKGPEDAPLLVRTHVNHLIR